MDSDLTYKPAVLHDTIQLAALLKARGEIEDAQRLLAQLTDFVETMRSHPEKCRRTSDHRQGLRAGGRTDEAIEQLELVVETPDWSPQTAAMTGSDPAFVELSRDPRYREAQARTRLAETFRRQGLDWPPE